MGWTGMQNDGVRRDARAHMARVLGTEERVLAAKRVGDVIYSAYWTESDQVIGLVTLMERSGGWTHYKVMGEDEGPNASECPAEILDVLDPIDSDYAMAWRARCRSNLLDDYRRDAALETT